MKKHSWLLICLSTLMLFAVACNPVPPPRLEVIIPAPTAEREAEEPMEMEPETPAEPEPVEILPPNLTFPAPGTRLLSGELVLTGTGGPRNVVQVFVNGEEAGVTLSSRSGFWDLRVSLNEPGTYEIQARALDADGAVAAEGESVSVTLVSAEEEEEAGETVVAPTSPPVEPGVAPDIVFPADGGDVILGELTLVGSGAADSMVEVLNGSEVLGTAEVGADGEWTFTLEPSAGEYKFAARAMGDESAVSGVITVKVAPKDEVDCDSNPGLNRGDTYIVGTCDTLIDISQQLEIDYEALVSLNPQIPNVDLIYPGEILTLSQ